MDFVSVILLLILYYIRPQEWIAGFAGTRPVAVALVLALGALLVRDRKLRLGDVVKTPHDWLMYGFFCYMIYTSAAPLAMLGEVKNRLVMYVVIVQALSDPRRLTKFVWWWLAMIAAVAAMAVLSEYGFDPTGAHDRTHTIFHHRLILNTSIFANPNALAHAVMPLVPMLYHHAFWRRGFVAKELCVAWLALPLYCIYLTKSKGGFVAAAATLILTIAFGRPLPVQATVWLGAWYGGTRVIYNLPRMDEMRRTDLKVDEGIWGRWRAFSWGLEKMDRFENGIGYGNFAHLMGRETGLAKAAHCSYVEVGTELGRKGLLLWLGVLVCCLHTLAVCKCRTVTEERLRRVLFAAVMAYMFSSWFTNISYRGTFFIQAACVGAFHRLLCRRDDAEAAAPDAAHPWQQDETPLFAPPPPEPRVPAAAAPTPSVPRPSGPPESLPPRPRMRWRWPGLLDLALLFILYRIVMRIWGHVVFSL